MALTDVEDGSLDPQQVRLDLESSFQAQGDTAEVASCLALGLVDRLGAGTASQLTMLADGIALGDYAEPAYDVLSECRSIGQTKIPYANDCVNQAYAGLAKDAVIDGLREDSSSVDAKLYAAFGKAINACDAGREYLRARIDGTNPEFDRFARCLDRRLDDETINAFWMNGGDPTAALLAVGGTYWVCSA